MTARFTGTVGPAPNGGVPDLAIPILAPGPTPDLAIPLGPEQPPPDWANFSLINLSGGSAGWLAGQGYSGPVPWLRWQLDTYSPSNVYGLRQNEFIHCGSGNDAINLADCLGGRNVADAGGGSNWIVSGQKGQDTIFVDQRGQSAPIWNTVEGFHLGDLVDVWGLSPQDFSYKWIDQAGAANGQGLTLQLTGGPADDNMTFAGFGPEAQSHLAVAFGQTQPTPDLPGVPYMQITYR